jgi:hypothetical protein
MIFSIFPGLLRPTKSKDVRSRTGVLCIKISPTSDATTAHQPPAVLHSAPAAGRGSPTTSAGTATQAERLSLSPARSRRQVHPVLSSDHCIRSGRAARAARAQPGPECLCGALGQVGEGGVPVQGDPLWRALPAASR